MAVALCLGPLQRLRELMIRLFLPPKSFSLKLRPGRGDDVEGVADAAVDRVGAACQLDSIGWASGSQCHHQVWQRVVGAAQVDRAGKLASSRGDSASAVP